MVVEFAEEMKKFIAIKREKYNKLIIKLTIKIRKIKKMNTTLL